ncbi:MAG: DUF2189 domain-containing protein [Rhodospirillales bacterium]
MTADLQPDAPRPRRIDVAAATVGDVRAALADGWRDFLRRPLLSAFFGLVCALSGVALIAGPVLFGQIWIAIAASVAFPLVAPFLAAGLYEMSRRLKRHEPFTATDILLVVFDQRKRELGWMAFVVLFVFWMWAYNVRLLLALFLQHQALLSPPDLAAVIFTTADGALFLVVGAAVGSAIASVLFTLTVISMPLLLDKDVDFITAIIASGQAVFKSPFVMLGWGAVIGAMTLAAVAPAFAGVIVVFPILGHASWHLYERLVSER